MSSFATSVIVTRLPPAAHVDGTGCQGNQRAATEPVGLDAFAEVHELTPVEREAAIEVCELRECFYEESGQNLLAEFMRECRRQLEATRYQGEAK